VGVLGVLEIGYLCVDPPVLMIQDCCKHNVGPFCVFSRTFLQKSTTIDKFGKFSLPHRAQKIMAQNLNASCSLVFLLLFSHYFLFGNYSSCSCVFLLLSCFYLV